MENIICEKELFSIREGGAELMLVKIELPESGATDECEKKNYFNSYYNSIREAARCWANEYAKSIILPEYAGLSPREQKFRFRRYEYKISYKAETCINAVEKRAGETLNVDLTFLLTRSGTEIFSAKDIKKWDCGHWLMLPPKARVNINRKKKRTEKH